ncbi:hypothetical protein SBDP1_700006 [Syntrophobacter sp. SbD1]|nr:hypothetical protein SBDP1_700006 [Syntrophobacter sp. SbD1]
MAQIKAHHRSACQSAVSLREEHNRGLCGQGGQKYPSVHTCPELAANASLVLLAVACGLLDHPACCSRKS